MEVVNREWFVDNLRLRHTKISLPTITGVDDS